MEQMQGLHTLVLLGEARQAYPTSPFGLPLAQPQITLFLASLAPSHAKALDMDSLHPRCLYLAQAEETTEAEASLPAKVIALPFPLVLKNRLILAEVKPQPEVCGLCHMQNSVLIFTLPRSTER